MFVYVFARDGFRGAGVLTREGIVEALIVMMGQFRVDNLQSTVLTHSLEYKGMFFLVQWNVNNKQITNSPSVEGRQFCVYRDQLCR